MNQKWTTTRAVFLSCTAVLFLVNLLGVVIFQKNVRVSLNTPVASLLFVFTLIRGLLACHAKDENLLLLGKSYPESKFYRYNRPTNRHLHNFYLNATIYFAAIPFYLPLAAFSEKNAHTLWCLLLLIAPQLAMAGIDMCKMAAMRKEQKAEDERLEKEKKEQEKREELGYWK